MTAKPSLEAPFTLKRVQEMLGLSRATINGLISSGFVVPGRGPRNGLLFSFQDLMLMRTALGLQKASIPPRKILQSLRKLKSHLPSELPLTGLRITAVGADVAVRDRSGQWQADSGQLLMDFEVAEVGGSVAFIESAPPAAAESDIDWFRRGEALEPDDAAGAEQAYRRAIEAAPSRPEAYLNLGALLCETRRCKEAVELYERAIGVVGHEPMIHFNHAIALEDLDRHADAIAAYERAVALDPAMADAHYNLGVLREKLQDTQGALRHFNAYRRLQPM